MNNKQSEGTEKGSFRMKKMAFFALLALCTQTVFAGVMGQVQSESSADFKGPYLGAGAGGFFPIYQTEVDTRITKILPYLSGVSGRGNLSSNNVFGNVFLGYGLVFNSLYLGPEVYLSAGRRPEGDLSVQALDSLPTEVLSTSTNTRLNAWEAGIDGRLGWLSTTNTLLFVRLGAAFNNMRLNSNSMVFTDGTFVPSTKELNYSASKSLVGFRAGAGIEQKLSARFSVRADYVYTYYGVLVTNGFNDSPPLGPIQNTTHVRLQSQAVMGSILYAFSV
jgi:opacity protein-like surface antigen